MCTNVQDIINIIIELTLRCLLVLMVVGLVDMVMTRVMTFVSAWGILDPSMHVGILKMGGA